MKASTSTVFLALAAAAIAASDQIPEQATWEITFNQVEEAANLSNLRSAGPDSLEARLMQRAWSFAGPLAFLRLARSGGTVRATLFLYWRPPGADFPSRQPTGPDVVCRNGICVLPIPLSDQRNWNDVVDRLAWQNACPPRSPDIVTQCGDCDQIWIKTIANGKYREQSCQAPTSETIAGDLLELMKASAQSAR
jgi:hypothetical protein